MEIWGERCTPGGGEGIRNGFQRCDKVSLCNFAGEEGLGSETHPEACPLGKQPGSRHPEMIGVESVWILRTRALVSDALFPTNNLGLFLHLEIEMIIPTTQGC